MDVKSINNFPVFFIPQKMNFLINPSGKIDRRALLNDLSCHSHNGIW